MKNFISKNLNIIVTLVLCLGLVWAFCLIHSQKKSIEENKKIYVYSLDEVLLKSEVVETKQKFDAEIVKLNDELLTAEKKIKSLKNAKVKIDFTDMYLKNLRIKRDELIENYQKTVEEMTKKINAALEEIIKEKNIPAIFVKKAVAVPSPYIIDITGEVIEKIKK